MLNYFFFLLSRAYGAPSKDSKFLCSCLDLLASLKLISLLERTGIGKEHEGVELDLCLEMSFVESQAKYKASLVHMCFFERKGKPSPSRNGRALLLKKALSPPNFRKQACGRECQRQRESQNPRHKGQSLLLPYLSIKCLCAHIRNSQ